MPKRTHTPAAHLIIWIFKQLKCDGKKKSFEFNECHLHENADSIGLWDHISYERLLKLIFKTTDFYANFARFRSKEWKRTSPICMDSSVNHQRDNGMLKCAMTSNVAPHDNFINKLMILLNALGAHSFRLLGFKTATTKATQRKRINSLHWTHIMSHLNTNRSD